METVNTEVAMEGLSEERRGKNVRGTENKSKRERE